ncbi:MAG: DUF2029 domain-containing protein [Proteobacteria bacterium]|nr:MAG: DUF2029 domain-containing protein [Pseudomonadota bacterium]
MNQRVNSRYSYLIVIISILGFIPQYLLRCNFDILYWMYNHFSTYFGDIWYCWSNYLNHNFPYPSEYPAGIQLIFRGLFLIPELKDNFAYYMAIMAVIFLIITLLISIILLKLTIPTRKILCFWLLAPSFLFYNFWNLDIFPILTMLLAFYCWQRNDHFLAIIALALGTTLKVFPIFVLPVYLLSVDKKHGLRLLLIFVLSWLLMNLPLMIVNWDAWIFPYSWQIQNNYSRTIQDGSWTWLLYVLLNPLGYGGLVGKISLILFASGYAILMTKYRDLTLDTKIVVVMIMFLLTDRVYSPQYDLYLLSALVLFSGKTKLYQFYLLEIPNLLQGLFLFFFKNHAILLQLLLLCKYCALILMLINVLQQKNELSIAKIS